MSATPASGCAFNNEYSEYSRVSEDFEDGSEEDESGERWLLAVSILVVVYAGPQLA
jgi:hypothetical protein